MKWNGLACLIHRGLGLSFVIISFGAQELQRRGACLFVGEVGIKYM